MTKSIACLILILSTQAAFAWPPTYGAEFVMSSPKVLASKYDFVSNPNGSPERDMQLDLVAHVRTKCAVSGCTIKETEGKFGTDYLLEFKDGFWIRYSFDPKVVEIMFTPSTLAEMRENQGRINEYVFTAGQEIGLVVPKEMGGHVNMGVNSMFDGNVESFLKFYVDYANHPDLTLGTLGKSLHNAPTLSVLGHNQRAALSNIVEDFYLGKVKTVQEAAKRIQTEVYTKSYYAPWGGVDHYQSVGLKYLNLGDLKEKDAPMELRGIRAQRSTEDFIKTAELMEKRVQYLNKNVSHIVYSETKIKSFSPSQSKTRFKMYVEESGLNFSDYESLLSETIIKSQVSPIADKNAKPSEKLKDLIGHFDLLSSSTYVREQFVDVLSNPDLQEDPKVKAYQRFFEKMANQKPIVTASIQVVERTWFHKVLKFLGLPKEELVEHINELGTKELYKDLHESIELKRKLNGSWKISEVNKANEQKKPMVFSCGKLF